MKKQTLFVMAILFALNVNATKWRVNNTPGVKADFSYANAAIDGASEGDTIYFEGSTSSYGSCTINKKLTIIGTGYYLSENDSTQATLYPSRIENIYITKMDENLNAGTKIIGISANKIRITATNISIIKCNISSLDLESYYVQWPSNVDNGYYYGASNCIFSKCIIHYFEYGSYTYSKGLVFTNNIIYDKFRATNEKSTYVFENNIFNSSDEVSISVGNSVISNNITSGTIYVSNNNLQNNLSNVIAADIYVSTEPKIDADYILKEDSPAIGAGLNGTDCGIFGGNSPYVLSGIPTGPRIYNAETDATATPASGLNIKLKITTEH